ncbi:hypothetical protein [Microvirga makkahensis]|uniref:Uncharacterized protein n=1 Tax=Microvirga makkahensis TaxID=1128670 RepID=A0A7X3MTH8_9HYPH|nr:hypothetical protein [Microvirga makkahensis]MXQ12924.1 hypothetical protein [Microvirga makkahensis]
MAVPSSLVTVGSSRPFRRGKARRSEGRDHRRGAGDDVREGAARVRPAH